MEEVKREYFVIKPDSTGSGGNRPVTGELQQTLLVNSIQGKINNNIIVY